MALIDDYKRLVSSIHSVSGEIPELKDRLVLAQQKEQNARRKISELELDKTYKSNTLLKQKLTMLTDEEYKRINEEQSQLETRISTLNANFEVTKSAIKKNTYSDKLGLQYNLLNQLRETISKYSLPADIPAEIAVIVDQALTDEKIVYTNAALVALIEDVVKSSEVLSTYKGQDDDSLQSRFLDYITFQTVSKSKLSDEQQLYIYFGYILLLLVLTIVAPVLPIALLGIVACISYHKYNQENKALLQFVLPFSRLKDGEAFLSNKITTRVDDLRAKDMRQLEQQHSTNLAPLLQEREALSKSYASAQTRIREQFSDIELRRSVEEQFQNEINAQNEIISQAQAEIVKINKFIASNEKRIPAMREKQQKMLTELSEVYLNPKVVGTSKTLTKSFFLGIDDKQGSLIEFCYDGKATAIVYRGDTSRVNKDVISMMLMQLLSSMSLNVLDIYLVDLVSAGTDYAVFFRKTLEERMHLCATDEATKEALETMHDMLILRTQEILTEAESLEEYNTRMLENKSLPREYVFFFIQDPSLDLMESQQFQQLLYNGPTVGIIPIVFISHTAINSITGINHEEFKRLQTFFQAFKGSYFIFDGKTSDLSQKNELCEAILKQLQKGSRG